MIERLESRQHLSATLAGNVLTIIGTDRADDIAIAAGKREFVVHDNGRRTAFDVRAVKAIRIHGLRGNDSIIVSPKLAIRASIEAGPGNDRIGGGAGDDTIFGQAGADVIVGNGGRNFLDAGPGNDVLEAFGAGNVFHGGAGSDKVAALTYVVNYSSGVEHWVYPQGQMFLGRSATIETDAGRLLFRYVGGRVSGDRPEFSSLERRADGLYQVRETFYYGYGGEEFQYSHTVDITDAMGSGFVFSQTVIYPEDFSEPVPVPSATETVMLLPDR